MAWYKAGGSADDGNELLYPVARPSSEDKLYSEMSIQNIALAIGIRNITVSEMADAIRSMVGGLNATEVVITSATYTSSDLEVT